MNELEKIREINKGLDKLFPKGRTPFKILGRLLEECGEVAKEVNHLEGEGKKIEKHGEKDKKKLAKELQDVLRGVLQLSDYYGVNEELKISIYESYEKMIGEGLINRPQNST